MTRIAGRIAGARIKRMWFWIPLSTIVGMLALSAAAQASTDHGNSTPSINFFSGGGGANAFWNVDPNDADGDHYDVQINTTTAPNGYAGIDIHHVWGTPTAAYPNSSFYVKSNAPAPNTPSLGSPRLVIIFSDGGRAELRPLTLSPDWQLVSDPNWDNHGGSCGFAFEQSWQEIQSCHVGTYVVNAYLTTDPYGLTYWIDQLNTDGQVVTRPPDNSNGGA